MGRTLCLLCVSFDFCVEVFPIKFFICPWSDVILYRQYGGYEYSQQSGFVPPEMMQQQPYTGQIYQPTQTYTPTSAQSFYGSNFEDEPPLLEGITCALWPKGRTPSSWSPVCVIWIVGCGCSVSDSEQLSGYSRYLFLFNCISVYKKHILMWISRQSCSIMLYLY